MNLSHSYNFISILQESELLKNLERKKKNHFSVHIFTRPTSRPSPQTPEARGHHGLGPTRAHRGSAGRWRRYTLTVRSLARGPTPKRPWIAGAPQKGISGTSTTSQQAR
jgi:hypothetical protein